MLNSDAPQDPTRKDVPTAMAQINLFASELTPIMREFLSTYRQGALAPIGAVRLLEEHPHPHTELMMASVDRGHILMEVSTPLSYGDIDWLYRSIIAGEHEYTRGAVTRYCIRRCLNSKSNSTPTESEWEVIKIFRRALESPSLALRHLNATYQENGFIALHKFPQVLVIEYDHIPNLPKRRYASSR